MNYGYKIHRYDNLDGARDILRHAHRRMEQYSSDNCYIVTGPEGIGKTNLELWLMEIWYDEFLKKQCATEFITEDLPPFIRALRAAQPGDGIALDEGGELSSVSSFDTMVKDMVKAFKVMRAKKFLTIICFTNPLHMHRYWREDRIRGVFFIPKIGEAHYYPKEFYVKKVLNVLAKGDQSKSIAMLKTIPAPLQFRFPEYKGRLKEAYQKSKMDNIDRVLNDLDMKYGRGVKPLSLTGAAKLLGVGVDSISRWIKAGYMKAQQVTMPTGHIRYHIYPDDVMTFKEEHMELLELRGDIHPHTAQEKSTRFT